MILAIFGGGAIGQRHAVNARKLGHHVHVYDTAANRGGDPDRFAPGLVDAVLICTPASTHVAVAEQLLTKGYHGPLFVEKPLAIRSDAPIFAAWPHPVTMVGYNWRFHPEIAPLRALVRRGVSLHLDCRTDIRSWPGATYSEPLLECSHEVDLACAFLDDPTAVHGGGFETESGAWIQLQHPRGDALIDVRWCAQASRRFSMKLPGWTHVDVVPSVHPDAPALRESYVAELRHFLTAVEHGLPTACPFSQGLRVVEICAQVKRLAA